MELAIQSLKKKKKARDGILQNTAELRWQPTTAGLVVDELESRCAVTLKANYLILTNVRAAAVVHKALVKICSKGTCTRCGNVIVLHILLETVAKCQLTALFDGLVAPVRTISELVANFAQLDALSAATLELVGAVARGRCTKTVLQNSK